VSFAATLCLALLAVYALTNLLLSIVVAITWRGGLDRARPTSGELLALRLLPAGGAALLTVTVALPAFLIHEPAHNPEAVGPLLVALAMIAVLTVGDAIRRGWRACAAARALCWTRGPTDRRFVTAGQTVDVVDVAEPIVAVVGGRRPRIVASQRVVAACSPEEFDRVIAHEAAHVWARDNLKLLLLVVSPDVLAWLPSGAALAARWRAAAELEADARATGTDRHGRVALASALIKVARLATTADRPLPSLSMPIAVDDVAGRVRELLSPAPTLPRTIRIWPLMMVCAVMICVMGVPLYGRVHQFIEALVGFGR